MTQKVESAPGGRSLGSAQGQTVQSHGHDITIGNSGNHTHTYARALVPVTESARATSNAINLTYVPGRETGIDTGSGGNHSHSATISNTGGAETRPRNVAALMRIKT